MVDQELLPSLGDVNNMDIPYLHENTTAYHTTLAPLPTVNWSSIDTTPCDAMVSFFPFRIVVNVFLVAPMCIIGFIGNTVSVMVLRVDNVNNTVSILLQALAVADNAYLITCMFFQTIKTISECTDWVPGALYTYPYIESYVWPFASIAQTSAVWLVMLVTVDRYIAICYPLKMLHLCTAGRAKKAVLIIVAAAVLYNVPRFLEHHTVIMPDFCRRVFRPVSMKTELRKNRLYFIIYKTIMFFMFRLGVPLLVLILVNIKLMVTLRNASRERALLTHNHKAQNTRPLTGKSRTQPAGKKDYFTTILVSVVSVFIVCQFPDFLLRTGVMLKHFTSFEFEPQYFNTMTNMMLTLNSSINCLVYCLTGKRFRKILARQMCRTFISHQHHIAMDETFSNDGTKHTVYAHETTM